VIKERSEYGKRKKRVKKYGGKEVRGDKERRKGINI
jgi:hypothetical protein